MTQSPATVPMTYTHLCAWCVIAGIGMPRGLDTVTLASGEAWSYSLIRDIDKAFAVSDRGAASAPASAT
ncbi:hypothetical protein [Accumulibacter sp.]|uniref:hypothetical protein n=1 Tax=Accumulibacter sp. TaxID=2053492 RepID=UPI0026286AC7|nr:hypothetical protein [Accumulibacter sp.]